jgi:hypothetical protein
MAQNSKRVVVTVDDDHVGSIEKVAEALRSAGMNVGDILSTTGIITGEVDEAGRRSMQSVPGVKAIEPDDEMHAI